MFKTQIKFRGGNEEVIRLLLDHWVCLASVTQRKSVSSPIELAESLNNSNITRLIDNVVKCETTKQLSSELWAKILEYLTPAEMVTVSVVCKQWRRVTNGLRALPFVHFTK